MKKKILSSLMVFMLLQEMGVAKTLAKVNGESITDKDVALLMGGVPQVSFDQLPEEAKEQVLNQAIERKLLLEQAKKDRIQNTKEYKEAVQNAQDDLMLQVFTRQELDKIKVLGSEIQKFYDDNKAQFVQPEMIRAKHILVASEAEAKSIIADLKKAGANAKTKFEELAKEKSTDSTGQNGGELGWFSREQVIPEFSNAAFKLKEGTYTDTPVKTEFGYHVIYLDGKRPSAPASLKDVEGQIEQNLKLTKLQENLKKKVEDLRKKAKVEISK